MHSLPEHKNADEEQDCRIGPYAIPFDDDSSSGLLLQERSWRCLEGLVWDRSWPTSILASRWIDRRTCFRRHHAITPPGRYVIGISLRSTRLRFSRSDVTLWDGTMPEGMVHVTAPGQSLQVELEGACDFVHLYAPANYLQDRLTAFSMKPGQRLDDLTVRDALIAQLARSLMQIGDHGGSLYAESVSNIILMRLLTPRPSTSRVGVLPPWRLRRVQEHIVGRIANPITLGDLAAAAGLSRMHFAAQFRAAMGCRPHDYLSQVRIERAKTLLSTAAIPLAEIALAVGFQTQSHFSTVFNRLTGETPGRWRRDNRSEQTSDI